MNHSLQPKDRQISVLISSTFRYLQEERDILIKKIFLLLRSLSDVDTRNSEADTYHKVSGPLLEAVTEGIAARAFCKFSVEPPSGRSQYYFQFPFG